MSVIGKVPYIEEVLSRLNSNLLTDLSDSLDGAYSQIVVKLEELKSIEKGIKPCLLDINNKLLNGIIVYNDYVSLGSTLTQCVFLEFTKTQKVGICEINLSRTTYKLVNEYCEIEEIRRILNDYLDIEHNEAVVKVVPTDIGSTGTAIQLTHDGSPISGQTPLQMKTVNGVSVIGSGDIETNVIRHIELTNIGNGILKSVESFTHHVLVTFEVETTGVHYGADFILHPYDNISVCLVAFRIILNGSFNDVYANLDENGYIIITLGNNNVPSDATFKCHVVEFND